MLKLNVFQHVVKLLKGTERSELPAELILEELAVRLPHEQPRQMFTTLLNWGRYGDIFGYSRDEDLFFLHRAEYPPHSAVSLSRCRACDIVTHLRILLRVLTER